VYTLFLGGGNFYKASETVPYLGDDKIIVIRVGERGVPHLTKLDVRGFQQWAPCVVCPAEDRRPSTKMGTCEKWGHGPVPRSHSH